MFRRWLKSGVETPPPEQYLPEPCQTPEKASGYAAAILNFLRPLLLMHGNESDSSGQKNPQRKNVNKIMSSIGHCSGGLEN